MILITPNQTKQPQPLQQLLVPQIQQQRQPQMQALHHQTLLHHKEIMSQIYTVTIRILTIISHHLQNQHNPPQSVKVIN